MNLFQRRFFLILPLAALVLFSFQTLVFAFPILEIRSNGLRNIPPPSQDGTLYNPAKRNDLFNEKRAPEKKEGLSDIYVNSLVKKWIKQVNRTAQAMANFDNGGSPASFHLGMAQAVKGEGSGTSDDSTSKDLTLVSSDPLPVVTREGIEGDVGESPAIPGVPKETPELLEAPTSSEMDLSLLGDMDGNGEFDLEDAFAIAQIAYGQRQATPEELVRADLNRDGAVDRDDVMLAAMLYSGVLTLEQIQDPNFNLASLLDENGNYFQQGSSINAGSGQVTGWQVMIGNFSDEEVAMFMKRLLAYLEKLKGMLAEMQGAEPANSDDVALLEKMVGFAQDLRQGKSDYTPPSFR